MVKFILPIDKKMETIFVQFAFLIFGIINFVVGILLIGSDPFVKFWENRYWQQDNGGHKKKETRFYNRYTSGVFHVLVGLIFIHSAIYVL